MSQPWSLLKSKPKPWPMWPLTIRLQGPLNAQHRDQVSVSSRRKVQLDVDVLGGRRGQVSRVDPAVIQAGTWPEDQLSETCSQDPEILFEGPESCYEFQHGSHSTNVLNCCWLFLFFCSFRGACQPAPK